MEELTRRTEAEKTQSPSKAIKKPKAFEENSVSRESKYKNDFELNMKNGDRWKPHNEDSTAVDQQQLYTPRKDNPEAGKDIVGLSHRESPYYKREEPPLVVAESSKVLESPLEWDEWTTNSEESSTISVLQTEAVRAGVTKSDTFDFLKTQKVEKKEDKPEMEVVNSTSRFRPIEDPIHARNLQAPAVKESLEPDSDCSNFLEYSEKEKRQTNETPRNYRRELSPHFPQDRRELSPSFRSRDSSATRFVAIDAYLGLKEKDTTADKKDEKRDRPFSYRSTPCLEPGPLPDNSSGLERNKNIQKRTEEVRREEEADIKEDLCSSLLSLKTREEVSGEGRKYSEEYLSGLKKLTSVESRDKDRGSFNDVDYSKYKLGCTDDSKSYYKSRQLLSENAELLKHSYENSRSSTPQPSHEDQAKGKKEPQELPGFLTKTPLLTTDPLKQERDVHFESEFPTFSAYLRRTYGQTYSYRTRENSEDNQDHYRTKNEPSNTVGPSLTDGAGNNKIKENESTESKAVKEDYHHVSGHKEVEHNSRRSHYLQANRSGLTPPASSTAETNNFLSRSKESVFETSGSAPAYGEVSTGSSKQMTKNCSAGRGKANKVDQREASPTIDLLQRSFESLQSALSNKELDLMEPPVRRMSPSPERFSEERRSDSSHSRSRSRTRKRTVQSQARSRDSSQKMRLKEMAPTYYEARHGQGEQPGQTQTLSPSLSEIEVIYKGSEPDNYNLNKKYIERYPMDFNDEDISVMKKFIHHKKEELPEMFYMDVETFKKYYVQSRVMEMKRESSNSRRSSLSSMHEIDTLEREASLPREAREVREAGPRWSGEKEMYQGGAHQSRSLTPGQLGLSASNIGLTQAGLPDYGSPHKRSVAVQMQVETIHNTCLPPSLTITNVPAKPSAPVPASSPVKDQAQDPRLRRGGRRREAGQEGLRGPGEPGAAGQQPALLRGEVRAGVFMIFSFVESF